MPPRIPKNLSKKKKSAAPVPQTPEDFLFAGTELEDFGDRWIDSGDVPKALRFYQRAYTHYNQAISKGRNVPGEGIHINDAAYNVARMQYVIYNKVVKNGVFDTIAPNTQAEVQEVVPQSLDDVELAHRRALELVEGQTHTDLWYTYGQVLSELGEEKEDLQLIMKAVEFFQKVLELQLTKLKQTADFEVEEGDENLPLASEHMRGADGQQQAMSKSEEVDIDAGVSSSLVVETIVSCLDCFNTLLELCRDDDSPVITPHPAVAEYVSIGLNGVQVLAREFYGIVEKFGVEGTSSGVFTSIGETYAEEAAIAFAQILSTCAEDLPTLVAVWTQPLINEKSVSIVPKVLGMDETIRLPATVQRYLAASDALIGFTERTGVPAETLWSALSQASALLKEAWNISSEATPTLKLQVLLARGDVDYMRTKVPLSAVEKHRAVLEKNAVNLYTSAMNLPLAMGNSLSTGGIGAQLLKQEAEAKRLFVSGNRSELKPGYERFLKNIL